MDQKGNGNETRKAWPDVDHGPVLEELIADLVHKLNNPLAAILGYAELVLPKIENPEIKRQIEIIRKEAEQASHIVRNLVASTKKRALKKERVDLNHLIEEVFRAKADELSLKNIQVKMILSRPLPTTMADPQQIKQVLINLINNAEEAIIGFHGFGEIRVKTLLCDGQIEITVADDGPGIRTEDVPKIFSLFFTSKGKEMGMGLPISHTIILQHGGRMWGESEWGNGATFHITLPITEGNEEEGASGKRVDSLRGLRGLVIDDESPVLAFVSEYLTLEGAEIDTARDIENALMILEKKEVDFVVCDMKMPGIDGEGFYRILGEKIPSLQRRIIFSTGDVMGRNTKAFFNSIKNPCIEKPFDLKHLKETIVDLLNSLRK